MGLRASRAKEGFLSDLLRPKSPEAIGHLLALKLIGNEGAHAANIDAEDLLTAFELMEYTLHELYRPAAKHAKSLAKKLTKKFGKKKS